MAPDERFVSVESESAAAELAQADGRYTQAETHLRSLLKQVASADYEWDEWLRKLAEVFRLTGRRREAGVLFLYLHYHDLAREMLPKAAHAERARSFALERRWPEAAREYAAAGLPVHAAVAHEEGRDAPRARDAWAALLGEAKLRDHRYERALLECNLGAAIVKCAPEQKTVPSEATRHLVAAQRLLEEAADEWETAGERERAFDCYQILIKLGQDTGAFENLAEGYVNSIRILAADGLKFYALQFYEDFVAQALDRLELHAAATLLREAAEYAARMGLPYPRQYLRRAAAAWTRESGRALEAGAAIEMVENALLAAAECASLAGDFATVRASWQALAGLALGERKRARYAALAARYAKAPAASAAKDDDEGEGPLPQFLRRPRNNVEIWFADLLEWENAGDPERVALAIVGDLRYPDSVRRRAVNLILDVAAARRVPGPLPAAALAAAAKALGDLKAYVALAPLERLYAEGDPTVRRAAVRALQHMFYKRSFVLLTRALSDPDADVRAGGLEALRQMRFPHAFQPLSRLLREHGDPKVRTAAIESLGKIGTVEAGELLIAVLRQEPDPLRTVARRALGDFNDSDMVPILRQQLELEANPELRKILQDLLAGLRRR